MSNEPLLGLRDGLNQLLAQQWYPATSEKVSNVDISGKSLTVPPATHASRKASLDLGGDILQPDVLDDADFETEIQALSPNRRALVHAFAHAVNESDKDGLLPVDLAEAVTAILDVEFSGRFSELLEHAIDLTKLPPARSPELWDSTNGGSAMEAIVRIFGYFLANGRMYQGVVKDVDRTLYDSYLSKKRFAKDLPALLDGEHFPTRSQYNTRLLEDIESAPASRRTALENLRRVRAYNEKRSASGNAGPHEGEP